MGKPKKTTNSTIGDIIGLRDSIEKLKTKKVVKFSAVFAKNVPKNKQKKKNQ